MFFPVGRLVSEHCKVRKILILCLAACFFVGCGKGSNGGPAGAKPTNEGIVLTQLDSKVQQPAVVSVSFRAKTRLDEPVPNLSIDNFEVFENGNPISSSEATPSIEKDPDDFIYNTLLLLDLSGSVLASSLEDLKQAALTYVNAALIDSDQDRGAFQIKLAFFDGREKIQTLADYTANKSALVAAIEGLNASISTDSSTNLYGAVVQGVADIEDTIDQYYFANTVSAGSLVIFSDGNDQAARVTQTAAFKAVDDASEGTTIFSIGLGGEIDPTVLNRIGRDGSQLATDITQLTAVFESIANRINDEVNSIYVFQYCSPKRSGAENQLTLVAEREGESGQLVTSFSAEGFTGGCQL